MYTKQQFALWTLKTGIFCTLWITLFNMIPAYAKLFMVIWYGGLFFQSAYFHRYAAHQTYTMSHTMEKLAFVGAYIFQGSSYLSAYTYALLHRLHHAYTDTEKDPHSPLFDESKLAMMRRTAHLYHMLFIKEEYMGKPVEEKFKKNIPQWHSFDRFAHGWTSRILWVIFYICSYSLLAYYVDDTAAWEWILVILFVLLSCFMGPLHGLIVNWYGHVWGYRNHERDDLSRNIGRYGMSVLMNLLMMGEDIHNNHHDSPSSANFAQKWWEYDFIYTLLWCMDKLKIIRLKSVSLWFIAGFFYSASAYLLLNNLYALEWKANIVTQSQINPARVNTSAIPRSAPVPNRLPIRSTPLPVVMKGIKISCVIGQMRKAVIGIAAPSILCANQITLPSLS